MTDTLLDVAPIAATDPLLVQVRRVADARDAAALLTQQLDAQRAAFDAANAGLLQLVADAKKAVAADEEQLRQLALARFAETGNKAPAPGVSIKIVQQIAYAPEDAFAWARGSSMALALDRKAFDAIAKATPLPFVTRSDLAVAAIARDLSTAAAEAA